MPCERSVTGCGKDRATWSTGRRGQLAILVLSLDRNILYLTQGSSQASVCGPDALRGAPHAAIAPASSLAEQRVSWEIQFP